MPNLQPREMAPTRRTIMSGSWDWEVEAETSWTKGGSTSTKPTASWEHQYDLRPGEFTPTDYSFDLPSSGVVDPSDPSDGLNPTESIFPTETILPADSFLPLEQGGVVHHDIHYDLMI
jgi:hypothetical protein